MIILQWLLSVTLTRGVAKFTLEVIDADCDQNTCANKKITMTVVKQDNSMKCVLDATPTGTTPFTLEYTDASYPGTGCASTITVAIDAGFYVVSAVQYDAAGTSALKQIPLPVPSVTSQSFVPTKTTKLVTVTTTPGYETVSLDTTGAQTECSLFNVFLLETASSTMVISKQAFSNTIKQTINMANMQSLTGGPLRPVVLDAAVATVFINKFKISSIIGITCQIAGTRKYVLYNLIPGTIISAVADTYAASTVPASMTAVYVVDTFTANVFDLGYSDTTAFYPGEIIELTITCDSVPASHLYTTVTLSVIPTVSEVVASKLRLVARLTQSTTPAAVVALLGTLASLRSCSISANKQTQTTKATAVFVTVQVYTTISLDTLNEKLQLNLIPAKPNCPGSFRFTFGSAPMLIHIQEYTAIPTIAKVFAIKNMKALSSGFEITISDVQKAALATALAADKTLGFVCVGALTVSVGTVSTVSVTTTATINAADDYVAPSIPIIYDSTLMAFGITFGLAVAPSCPKYFLIIGTNVKVIHGLPLISLPTADQVFSIAAMQKLGISGTTELSDAESATLYSTASEDHTVGFLCLTGTLFSYTASFAEGNLTGEDKAVNTAVVSYDQINYKMKVSFFLPTNVSCNTFKVIAGVTPTLMHIAVFSAVPAKNYTYDLKNMYKIASGNVSNSTDAEKTGFYASLGSDRKVGFLCLSDLKTQHLFNVTLINSVTISDNDTYTAPTADVATENKITFNATSGTFLVGVVGVKSLTAFKKGDTIKIQVAITSTINTLTSSAFKRVFTSYELEPVEFIASDAHVVGGTLAAAVSMKPKMADVKAVAALIAAGTYSTRIFVTQNNAATPILVTISASPSGLSGGAIAGIVIGSVVFAGGVAVGLYFLIRHCKNKKSGDPKKNDKKEEPMKKNKKDINEPEEPPKSSKFGKNTDKNIDQSSVVQRQTGTVMKQATLSTIKDGKSLPKVYGTTGNLLSKPVKKQDEQLEQNDKSQLSIEQSDQSEQRRKQFVRRKKEAKQTKDQGPEMTEDERKKTVDGLLNNAIGEEGGAEEQ